MVNLSSFYIHYSMCLLPQEDTLCETSSTLIKIVPKFHPRINCIQLRNQVTTSFHKDHFFLTHTKKIERVIEYMQFGLSTGMLNYLGVMRCVESRKCVLIFLYFLWTNHSMACSYNIVLPFAF